MASTGFKHPPASSRPSSPEPPVEDRDALRARWVAQIPSWYSPWLHLAFPSAVGIGIIAGCIALLRDVKLWQLGFAVLVWVFSNAVEWRSHRNVLHRRTRGLEKLYVQHTPHHHRLFITDDMAMRSTREFRFVLIPFYGILVILAIDLPVFLLLMLLHQRNLAALYLATSIGYTLSYEWLHLTYHLPPASFIGRRWLVRVLRRHHATHHNPALMQHWNFNVTIPFWDWVRGTIYRG